MEFNEQIKQELHSSLLNIAINDTVSWSDFIIDSKNIIIMFYKNENLNTYKSQWRYYFKEAALFLSLQIKKDDREDIWKEIISTSLSSTVKGFCSKSTSTLNYQEALKESDFHQLENNHQKIAKKWLLKSGRNVEDIIYDFAKDFKYEHPAHSYILDLKTADWESYFSAEELVEVKSAEDYTFNRTLPENLNTMLMLLNGKSSFREIYNSFKNLNADPVEDPEEFWLKRSVVDFTLLFTDNEEHEKYTTEQELLDDVYSFIKNSKKISGAKATKNAVSSSAEYKNDTRSISSKERISRQASGDRPDLCFSYLSNEIGCLEIGLEDHGANGTKEINESSIKLPMMMKNFFTKIYNQYDFPTNDVKVVGIVISGMYLSALVMTFKNGTTSLISRSKRFKMPENVAEIPSLLPPILKLIYNMSIAVKETISFIKGKSSMVNLEEVEKTYLPPGFMPTNNSNKRKAPEI